MSRTSGTVIRVLYIAVSVIIVGGIAFLRFGASGPAFWTPTFEEGKPCHWLVMSASTQEEFDDDEHIKLGGIPGSLSGHVVLYLNGSPMEILTGGVNLRLEEFLESGVNTVEVRGKHEKPISVRVCAADFCDDLIAGGLKTGGFRKTIAKVFVPPEREDGSVEFKVDGAKGTPFEVLPQSGEKREAAERSLRDLLGDLQHNLDNHDGKGFSDLLFRNRLKVAKMCNTDIDDRQDQPAMAEVCSLPNTKFVGDLGQSKIVWGERLVLVWSGEIAEDSFGDPTEPYSFQIVIENNTTKYSDRSVIPPLRYGMIDGEWVRL